MLCSPLHLFGLDYAVFPADRDRGSVSKHLYLYFISSGCPEHKHSSWERVYPRLHIRE